MFEFLLVVQLNTGDRSRRLRLLYVGRIEARYIPEVLVCMRVGGASNRSLRNIVRKSTEDLRIMRNHGVGGVGALMLKNVGKLSQFWRR